MPTEKPYTKAQIYASLIQQGYPPGKAKSLAEAAAKGTDSPFWPGLGDEVGTALGYYGVARGELPQGATKKQKFGRMAKKFGAAGALSTVGSLGGAYLSGSNFYDRASNAQLAANIGGGFLGNTLGDIAGRKLQEKLAARAATKVAGKAAGTLAGKAAGTLAGKAAGKAAGTLAGRALGTVVGGPLAPITGTIGGILGGWLLPKFFADEPPPGANNLQENSTGYDTIAALSAGGAVGKGTEQYARDQFLDDYYNMIAKRSKASFLNPF